MTSGELSRYIAESITTDAGRFDHVGLCQLRTQLAKAYVAKTLLLLILLTISSPDIDNVAMSLYDIMTSTWPMFEEFHEYPYSQKIIIIHFASTIQCLSLNFNSCGRVSLSLCESFTQKMGVNIK